MPKLYAAYGSNLNRSQMRQICGREVDLYGVGKIEGYKLEFRIYVNIRRKKDSIVPVAVWEVTDDDLVKLDRFEGVYQGVYKKTEIKANMSNGEVVGVFVYVLQKRIPVEKPYRTYYEVIADGYAEHNLDVTFLKEVAEKAAKH